MKRIAAICSYACCVLAAVCLGQAQAQDYPNRAVRIVNPSNPGGGIDMAARVYADELAKRWKTPPVVENRPGAAGLIAAQVVAAATPDGYTILAHSDAAMAYQFFYKSDFNPEKQLIPLAMLASAPYYCIGNPNSPGKSWAELVRYAKANPGKLNFGTFPKTTNHLELLRLVKQAGIDVTFIPYNNAPGKFAAVLANDVQAACNGGLSGASELVKSGKLAPLAVATSERVAAYPEFPTFKSAGLDYEGGYWTAWWVPAGTPRDIIARLTADLAEIIKSQSVAERLAKVATDAEKRPPSETVPLIRQAAARFGEAAAAAGIKPD